MAVKRNPVVPSRRQSALVPGCCDWAVPNACLLIRQFRGLGIGSTLHLHLLHTICALPPAISSYHILIPPSVRGTTPSTAPRQSRALQSLLQPNTSRNEKKIKARNAPILKRLNPAKMHSRQESRPVRGHTAAQSCTASHTSKSVNAYRVALYNSRHHAARLAPTISQPTHQPLSSTDGHSEPAGPAARLHGVSRSSPV